jgi:hypothetical protein
MLWYVILDARIVPHRVWEEDERYAPRQQCAAQRRAEPQSRRRNAMSGERRKPLA